MPPRISAAMIIRDEAERLEECLLGLEGLADEICVVDTGSKDDSFEIAQRCGCKTSRFDWCNDFSAARNASLALCSGEWVFILDADERLAREDIRRLRALTDGPRDSCYRFVTRNYTNVSSIAEFTPSAMGDENACGFAGWYPSSKVRLFPNGLNARFEGRVHELVNPSLERLGVAIRTADIPIHHYPLLKSEEEVRRKRLNYVEIGLAKIRDNPQDDKAYAELGAQYAELGDIRRAAAAYRDAARLRPENAAHLRELGAMLQLLDRREEARNALEMALRMDPEPVEGWRNLGVIHAGMGRWEEALACFQEALSRGPGHSESHRCLAVALENTGQRTRAAEAAREAVRLDPRSELARALFLQEMTALERQGEAQAYLDALG